MCVHRHMRKTGWGIVRYPMEEHLLKVLVADEVVREVDEVGNVIEIKH